MPVAGPSLDGDEAFQHCRRRVLEGEVEHRLAAQDRAAKHLQHHGRLSEALSSTENGEITRTQSPPEIGVERREAGGNHPRACARSTLQTLLGIGEDLTKVADTVRPWRVRLGHRCHDCIEPRRRGGHGQSAAPGRLRTPQARRRQQMQLTLTVAERGSGACDVLLDLDDDTTIDELAPLLVRPCATSPSATRGLARSSPFARTQLVPPRPCTSPASLSRGLSSYVSPLIDGALVSVDDPALSILLEPEGPWSYGSSAGWGWRRALARRRRVNRGIERRMRCTARHRRLGNARIHRVRRPRDRGERHARGRRSDRSRRRSSRSRCPLARGRDAARRSVRPRSALRKPA